MFGVPRNVQSFSLGVPDRVCGLTSAKQRIKCLAQGHNIVPSGRERSGSVVECLTRDLEAADSSLTGVTALWSLSKTHLS